TIFMGSPPFSGQKTTRPLPVYAGRGRVVPVLDWVVASPGLAGLGLFIEADVASMAAGGDLPRLHRGQDGAAGLLHVGTAHEAALPQVGAELPEGLGQGVLVHGLAAPLLVVEGGEARGVGDESP